jgi:hypothetical protein
VISEIGTGQLIVATSPPAVEDFCSSNGNSQVRVMQVPQLLRSSQDIPARHAPHLSHRLNSCREWTVRNLTEQKFVAANAREIVNIPWLGHTD